MENFEYSTYTMYSIRCILFYTLYVRVLRKVANKSIIINTQLTATRVCTYEQLDEASAYIKALETKLTEKSLQQQQRVAPAESAPARPQQQPYAPTHAYQPQPPPAASHHQSRLRSRDESAPPVSASSSSRRVPRDGRLLEGSADGDELTDRPLPSSSRVSEMQHMIEARDALIREDRQLMHQSLATLSLCFFYM